MLPTLFVPAPNPAELRDRAYGYRCWHCRRFQLPPDLRDSRNGPICRDVDDCRAAQKETLGECPHGN